MSVPRLSTEELGFESPAPLWYYILREAELKGEPRGQRLGPVGGRIVAETFLGLLDADPLSYLSVEPDWSPEKEPLGEAPIRSMADLVRFAVPALATRE